MRLSLCGEWRLTGVSPENGETHALAGQVPGHVHTDLLRAGLIPDPFWREQSRACQWVEKWDWTYEKEFDLPADFDRTWAALELDGLDTFAAIILNDTPVGRTDNMFIPHRFEVGALLRPGRNRLQVRFENIWKHVAGKRRDLPCAFENPERLYVRRMQCTFAWDWVERFVSYGIWRPVTLTSHARARIVDLCVSTERITGPDGQGQAVLQLQVETELRGAAAVNARLEVADPDGRVLWHQNWQPRDPQPRQAEAVIPQPRLWWPNGYGAQPLYTARLRLSDEAGAVVDARDVAFGIRTVAIEEQDDAPGSPEEAATRRLRAANPELETANGDAPGRSFIVRVNGERIFCKGGNWVPADPWPSRVTPQRYDQLIGLAREGGINCLRAWGGGLYEPEAFWDACNRHGILVCQDFMMACAQYPEDDPAFLEQLQVEVPAVIRRLRNHPALAWWIGDNENGMRYDFDDSACWGARLVREIIRPALARLDPARPFFPTSPYGGRKNTCLTIGDTHHSALPWEKKLMDRDWRAYRSWFPAVIGRFNSECVATGVAPLRSLRRFMSEADLQDPAGPVWYHHTKDNPYTDLRMYDVQNQIAGHLFGAAATLEQRVRQLEYIQYEWVRLTMEAARRAKWYNAGLLFWMYNDCWPGSDWSLVDYYGQPKAGWYAMKRACQPLLPSIEETAEGFRLWVCNDALTPVAGTCRVRLQPWVGAPAWEQELDVAVPANHSEPVASIAWTELPGAADADAVLACDLCVAGREPARAWLYRGLPREMNLPPARLSADYVRTPDGWAVRVSTDRYARVVTLEAGAAVFADNYFDLLPGEQRTIAIRQDAPPAREAELLVSAWNAARDLTLKVAQASCAQAPCP